MEKLPRSDVQLSERLASLGIMRAQLRAPNTMVLWWSEGFEGCFEVLKDFEGFNRYAVVIPLNSHIFLACNSIKIKQLDRGVFFNKKYHHLFNQQMVESQHAIQSLQYDLAKWHYTVYSIIYLFNKLNNSLFILNFY